MASHLDAIGLAANDGPGIDRMVQRLMLHGEVVGSTPESQRVRYRHQDAKGVRTCPGESRLEAWADGRRRFSDAGVGHS
jgi:hypothetical protein